MHSSTLQVSDTEMKASLGKMIALLEDPQELKDNPEAKNAIKQIEEVRQDGFTNFSYIQPCL